MKKYEIYTTIGDKMTSFESEWQFSENEQIFVHFEDFKKNFVIIHITHDVVAEKGHVTRLYCQEKRVFS